MQDKIVKHPATDTPLSAGAFRNLADAFAKMHIFPDVKDDHLEVEQRIAETRAFVEQHVEEPMWRERLLLACDAIRDGVHAAVVLRFPKVACSDGGRAIKAGESFWPNTLTGAEAEIYRVWQLEFAPRGFDIKARTIDNHPGEIELLLSWGR